MEIQNGEFGDGGQIISQLAPTMEIQNGEFGDGGSIISQLRADDGDSERRLRRRRGTGQRVWQCSLARHDLYRGRRRASLGRAGRLVSQIVGRRQI